MAQLYVRQRTELCLACAYPVQVARGDLAGRAGLVGKTGDSTTLIVEPPAAPAPAN